MRPPSPLCWRSTPQSCPVERRRRRRRRRRGRCVRGGGWCGRLATPRRVPHPLGAPWLGLGRESLLSLLPPHPPPTSPPRAPPPSRWRARRSAAPRRAQCSARRGGQSRQRRRWAGPASRRSCTSARSPSSPPAAPRASQPAQATTPPTHTHLPFRCSAVRPPRCADTRSLLARQVVAPPLQGCPSTRRRSGG